MMSFNSRDPLVFTVLSTVLNSHATYAIPWFLFFAFSCRAYWYFFIIQLVLLCWCVSTSWSPSTGPQRVTRIISHGDITPLLTILPTCLVFLTCLFPCSSISALWCCAADGFMSPAPSSYLIPYNVLVHIASTHLFRNIVCHADVFCCSTRDANSSAL